MKKTRTVSIVIKIKTLITKISIKFKVKYNLITFIHKFSFHHK